MRRPAVFAAADSRMEELMRRVNWIGLVVVLGFTAVFFSALQETDAREAGGGNPDLDACYREIRELRADINLLNLYNGMHLTIDQVEVILREARAVTREGGGQPELVPIKELKEEIALLDDVRKRLRAGKEVSTTSRARYDNTMRRRQMKNRSWYTVEMRALVEKSSVVVEDALTDSQIEVLATFKPCLIPPKDLKDPVRVGQASDSSRFITLLEKVRALPEYQYKANREKIVENLADLAEKHTGRMKSCDRESYEKSLHAAFQKARGMTEEDFLFNKQELAAGLEPPDQIGEIQEKLERMGVTRFAVRGKIAHYFLQPRTVPILEKRLEQMKRFERDGQVDLDRLKGAESCRDGKCAID